MVHPLTYNGLGSLAFPTATSDGVLWRRRLGANLTFAMALQIYPYTLI